MNARGDFPSPVNQNSLRYRNRTASSQGWHESSHPPTADRTTTTTTTTTTTLPTRPSSPSRGRRQTAARYVSKTVRLLLWPCSCIFGPRAPERSQPGLHRAPRQSSPYQDVECSNLPRQRPGNSGLRSRWHEGMPGAAPLGEWGEEAAAGPTSTATSTAVSATPSATVAATTVRPLQNQLSAKPSFGSTLDDTPSNSDSRLVSNSTQHAYPSFGHQDTSPRHQHHNDDNNDDNDDDDDGKTVLASSPATSEPRYGGVGLDSVGSAPRTLGLDLEKKGSLAKPSSVSLSMAWDQGPQKPRNQTSQSLSSPQSPRQKLPTPEARTMDVGNKTEDQGPISGPQLHLIRYREKLARELENKMEHQLPRNLYLAPFLNDSPQNSGNNGDVYTPPLQTASAVTSTSTESGNTIRGGVTPGLIAATPSYPFPRMAPPTPYMPGAFARLQSPFTMYSNNYPSQSRFGRGFVPDHVGMQEALISASSTPGSTMTFAPPGVAPPPVETIDYPTPCLYNMSMMLSAEPGLEPWWNTVVQLMVGCYQAERVTLAVPADPTDLHNVPWGQKATYNAHGDDEFSIGYLARTNSLNTGCVGDVDASFESPAFSSEEQSSSAPVPTRPLLPSRHSFTVFEENRSQVPESAPSPMSRRPALLSRSKSYFPTKMAGHDVVNPTRPMASLNQQALQEHDEALEQQQQQQQQQQHEEEDYVPSWEAPIPCKEGRGRVLSMLQALDYEADPLIDSSGIGRILERGKVIALTRTYPYLEEGGDRAEDGSQKARSGSSSGAPPREAAAIEALRRKSVASAAKLSSILNTPAGTRSASRAAKVGSSTADRKPGNLVLSRLDDESPKPPTPKYEEYEQAPPSPWSQSPAPSPAVRPDPKENPFFTDAMVDEETFNPSTISPDYSTMIRPPEAIGIDNSYTVLHVPLAYPPLARPLPQPSFRLDASGVRGRYGNRNNGDLAGAANSFPRAPTPPDDLRKHKPAPIAILSIQSPVIPYPSNLRHSLDHLSGHLATSFSLARQYTMLETELAGLRRRRPHTAGFGAVAAEGTASAAAAAAAAPYAMADDLPVQQLSLGGSITSPSDYSTVSKSAVGTPGVGTPGWDQGSFVGSRLKPQTSSPSGVTGDSYFNTKQKPASARGETPSSVLAQRTFRNSTGSGGSPPSSPTMERRDRSSIGPRVVEEQVKEEEEERGDNEKGEKEKRHKVDDKGGEKEKEDMGSEKEKMEKEKKEDDTPKMDTDPNPVKQRPQQHTQLHTYGADFASTFQSLPPSAAIGSRTGAPAMPISRNASVTTASAASILSHDMPPPSDRLKTLMLDTLPAHVFVALPQTGEIVWVNSRYLSYRGQTIADLMTDPWGSIHPDDRDEYLKAWCHSLRTGEQFSRTVRIRRFDLAYRWFYARAVASRDKRGVIMQFIGSYMDIHDQHVAELKAARQEEMEASEAKHRLLANLIPQIIFTATGNEGITFANEQWLSYTGQTFDDCLGLGFMDYVHPDDLAKCRIPSGSAKTAATLAAAAVARAAKAAAAMEKSGAVENDGNDQQSPATAGTVKPAQPPPPPLFKSACPSGTTGSLSDMSASDLAGLAKKGIVKVGTDNNGRPSYTTEVRLRSRSGEYRWHLIRCVEIDNIDFGSGASSYFGSATDINDHKLLEAKLKEAMESKTRFLSNMSHEIRTPLIGISGMVSFLQETTLNEEQRDYTNTIHTSANSLLLVINDILDLSKVDAGMMRLNFEWFHTRSLIEDVNELVSSLAVQKHLELNYVVDEDVPDWLKGDKIRIRQVLLNVIGNAIKFTTRGEVFSRCRVYQEESLAGENEVMLEFAIMDTGRGFTEKEAELIFKPFSQIDGSSTRQHGGSGLGLVISRQLTELHGGTMTGTAVPGKGSTFTFTAKFGLPTETDFPDPKAAATRDNYVGPIPAGFRPFPSTNTTTTTNAITTSTSTTTNANVSGAAAEITAPPSPSTSDLPGPVTKYTTPAPSPVVATIVASAPFTSSAITTTTGSTTSTSTTKASPFIGAPTPDTSTSTIVPKPESSSPALVSSGGSDPSIRSSALSAYASHASQTSDSSVSVSGLGRFSEAAKAGHWLNLEMPANAPEAVAKSKNPTTPYAVPNNTKTPYAVPENPSTPYAVSENPKTPYTVPSGPRQSRYSILIVCPQTHSREATAQHIEMTLPKDAEREITTLETVDEAQPLIVGAKAKKFTHIVLNLPSAEAILGVMDMVTQRDDGIKNEDKDEQTTILLLSDPVQRQAVVRLAANTKHADLLSDNKVLFVYKPVKPSRFAVIFDPLKVQDSSIDRNRSSAQRLVENQKASYVRIARYMHGKGYKVLLVEDNPVNQKVMTKYLLKVGVVVELASDGEECVKRVMEKPHGYYALILCDLHMPRKDGYQACREIREWETANNHPQLPMIALSANVMSDVQDKCLRAGFNSYVTKPVDFIQLSTSIAQYFIDPDAEDDDEEGGESDACSPEDSSS